ncbi:DNA sulfur modification protein DndD [Bradyrhizobium sp. AUGA SZCCT0177]|uniref:DNA sulfur modification protein DndD n=1 Tax=Bradyrhizobium sp. AUGA SZCCT0177 TaxID=2807665 RepID=UPI001BA603FE|nr:DNA sulfur modification protein DndD [Bradyrhizobium sp. AUGA SZCCT0177]MBR1285376.1 DNA sulfur modification protein DndD [Bradyrhizobium sp. AUGA SZCCT0177]
MIFNELKLHNFGVYKGLHALDLTPTSTAKPIVLIGALNGSGKTTIIEALHLALYGRQGMPAGKRANSFESYLRSAIHKDVDPSEGASVGLRFAMQEEGHPVEYELVRTWSEKSGKVREDFEVYRNGKSDKALSELWSDHVQELLPPRIAPLFFFDGEKIEELADLKKAPELVREAIKSLLGLDIVGQLESDLLILERRKFASVAPHIDQKKLKELEHQLTDLESRRSSTLGEIAQARAQVAEQLAERERAAALFRDAGGDLFNQHEALRSEQVTLEAEYKSTLTELRQLATGVLPLALVGPLLKRAIIQSEAELNYGSADQRHQTIEERDQFVEQLIRRELKDLGPAEIVIEALRKDRASRKPIATSSIYLGTTAQTHSAMRLIEGSEIPSALDKARERLIAVAGKEKELSGTQRKLAAVPDRDTVQGLTDAISVATAKSQSAQSTLERQEKELAEFDREVSLVQRSLKQLIEERVSVHNENADAERIIKYSKFVRGALEQFGDRVVKHHIRRIEALVEEALENLFRKTNLIAKVTIDPKTFEITLRGSDEQLIPAELLSAGERQLLATALLWALAQAAGRQIPTAIDTPLGRLDSVHRHKLVESYFPRASHQVILLSTDEEISGVYYKALMPAISHSYTLKYDDETRSSHVENGYAFALEAARVH